jgi:hypothetical protein
MNDGNIAIHMVPYTEGKVPSMALGTCDGYSVADTLVDISGCMSDRRNKEGHTGAGILATAHRHGPGGIREPRNERLQPSFLLLPSDIHGILKRIAESSTYSIPRKSPYT